MSENTKIEWCDHTFNPWIGCTKISPACDHCYAAQQDTYRHWTPEGWGGPRKRTSAANWKKPLQWNAQADAFMAQHGRRQRVFCASLADVFDNAVDPQWRADLFGLIDSTPHLDWLLLTKRVGNVLAMTKAVGNWPANAWLGVTACNQADANRDVMRALRIKPMLSIPVLFLSIEPLLGPMRLSRLTALDYDESPEGAEVYPLRGLYAVPDCDWRGPKVDWVIVGGESGPGARPMHPDWAASLRDQCKAAGVPFLFKQWGEWKPICQMEETEHSALYKPNAIAKPHECQDNLNDIYGRRCTVPYTILHADGSTHGVTEPMAFREGTGAMQVFRIGKKAAGRLLDGREWDEAPT